MSDRLFYIDGEWRTYEQAHSLGYSLLPQRLLNFYTDRNEKAVIKQDSGDDTYYDSANFRWVADFAELGLYKKVKTAAYYRGESSDNYSCYIASISDAQPTHILYNSFIVPIGDAYENYGITSYECENIILDENSSPLVWYDSQTGKYFDDRDGFHRWVDSIDDTLVTMYDSLATLASSVYESESLDAFYINSHFISRSEFYSHDNYGIIRDTTFTFKDEIVYTTYYDSYSDEYCIPNVTDVWMSKDDILELGYTFVEGVADMWLCETPLYLPWKYRPNTVIVSFTCSAHEELHIQLPADMEVIIGSSIQLPDFSGIYSDSSFHKYSAVSWSVGEFGEEITITENTVADLIVTPVFATVHFTNESHPEFEVDLPDDITIETGNVITLPDMYERFKDDDSLNWMPVSWGEYSFNSQFIVKDDVSLDLSWLVISTYNVIDEPSGNLLLSGQSIIVTSCIRESVVEQTSLEYAGIVPKVIESDNLTYSTILPSIINGNHLVIQSAESIPPADIVIYNTETNNVDYHTQYPFAQPRFKTSASVIDNPEFNIVHHGVQHLAISDIYDSVTLCGTRHIVLNDNCETIVVSPYEDIVLYLPCGLWITYYYQERITPSFNGEQNSDTIYQLYSDPECTVPAIYDASKLYEAGYFDNGNWVPLEIQSASDMPESPLTYAKVIVNDNGAAKLWFVTNYYYSGQCTKLDYQYDSSATYTPFYFRVYSN